MTIYFTASDSKLSQPGELCDHIYNLQEHFGPVILQALGSLFVASHDSESHGGGIQTLLQARLTLTDTRSQSCVTTGGRSSSILLCQAPVLGPRPDFYYCQTTVNLLMWGALCDKRKVLSFTMLLALVRAVILGC
jgi:hypothetical protein